MDTIRNRVTSPSRKHSRAFPESPVIGVKLPDEAGEVPVLEILGKQRGGECVRIPHDEAIPRPVPRDHRVR